MADPQSFCREVMHEYEQQWSNATGHPVRHPLRLKMERLKDWCEEAPSVEAFEERLARARASDDAGEALLGDELMPLWRTVRDGGSLPFASAESGPTEG